jgi:hypothetical protein
MIYFASTGSINLSLCCCFFLVCAYNSLLWCGNALECCSYAGVLQLVSELLVIDSWLSFVC